MEYFSSNNKIYIPIPVYVNCLQPRSKSYNPT